MKRTHPADWLKKNGAAPISVIFLAVGLFFPNRVSAADFTVQIDRTYSVAETRNYLHITEKRTVSNQSSGYIIPKGSSITFSVQNFKEGFGQQEKKLKEQSIRVTNAKGQPLVHTVTQSGEDIVVDVAYPTSITYGDSLVFILEYDTDELIEKVGSLTNIYIPGLDSTYTPVSTDPSTYTTTEILYTTTLKVPTSLGTSSFTLPSPISISKTDITTDYSFSTESIIGTSVWLQIGTSQTYFFSMRQNVPQTDTSTPDPFSFLSKAQYEILLPRDYSETDQKVYFTKIEPPPSSLSIDNDGNAKATFYLDANKESSIVIEGYITLSLSTENNIPPTADLVTVEQISEDASMSAYLGPAVYWESEAEEIIAKAQELAKGKNSILEILHADYTFIVQSIDYDDFKYGDRNTRRGALATLKGGSSVCMEYSDLLIALARAQGIPARAAYGYGYDPKLLPNEQEEHQWVQAWVPGYGWLTIDPTWGETGRQFIGKDLDHALWYVASKNPNVPSPLMVTAAETNFNLEETAIEIIAVDGIPENITLKSLSDINEEISADEKERLEIIRRIQTSMMGRTLVIIIPVMSLLIGFTVISKLLSIIFNGIKRSVFPQTPPLTQ